MTETGKDRPTAAGAAPRPHERTDQRGSRILSQSECHDLLNGASGGVGHLGLVTAGAVTVLPLNFITWSGEVIICLAPGSTLEALAGEPLVAFTVDAVDSAGPEEPEAWSVLVQGTARIVRDPVELADLEALGLTPLVGEPGRVYVRIHTERLTGRRFAFGALARFRLLRSS